MAISERMLDTSSPVDLFGRTEAQLVAAIAKAELLLEIQKVWRGNDRLGAEIERAIGQIGVDRRQLAIMRGEIADDSPRLSVSAREKLHREILALGRTWNGAPKEGK